MVIKHHAMETYVGMDLENVFLTLAPDGGKWVTSRPFCFIFGESHISHWVGDYLDPIASVDTAEKRKYLAFQNFRNLTSIFSTIQFINWIVGCLPHHASFVVF